MIFSVLLVIMGAIYIGDIMKSILAYDLPIRIFHWIFALLFVTSFFIAKVIDDDSVLYAYHMISGLMMAVLVFLRILWGFWGTTNSRFSSFELNLNLLKEYLTGILTGKAKRYFGHNPASSYAALGMFLLTFSVVGSGLLMVNRINKGLFEEFHELFANFMFLLVILHVAGVVLHQLRHHDGLVFTMFSGRKKTDEDPEPVEPKAFVAFIILAVVAGSGMFVLSQYDQRSGVLNLIGTSLQLGDEGFEEHESQMRDADEDDDEHLEHGEGDDD